MAERWELGLPKMNNGCSSGSNTSLKEQLARTTLQKVRSQGHPYVDLREDGKRFVFFCTLCLAPCYSDSVLLDHLKGSLHTDRLAAAKVTLLKPNPWPFNDGVRFFDNSSENGKEVSSNNVVLPKLLGSHENGNNLAIDRYDENLRTQGNGHAEDEADRCENARNVFGMNCDMLIPGVLVGDEISVLEVRFVGSGQIAARSWEKDDGSNEICRIWCEWLGKGVSAGKSSVKVTDHDFAVITFSYNYKLGRKGLLDDVKLLLSSSPSRELENGRGFNTKRKKSFSDPEDVSESLRNQYDSSGEESSASNGSSSRFLLDQYGHDDQLLHTRFISSKTIRRELRRKQRIAAERMCDICQQKMLPEKDVATLMNLKTGKLACSSRNVNGAFHVYHTSCLIHWILLCEFEMFNKQPAAAKGRGRSKRKNGFKCCKVGKAGKAKAVENCIHSVFCPECQGTGVNIEDDELEIPTIPLLEMFKYKIKVSDGHRAWMKNPEMLQNCSTGFGFPSDSGETVKGKVLPLKLLNFYRAEE